MTAQEKMMEPLKDRSVELNDIPISPLHYPSGIAKIWQLSKFE